MSFSTVLGGTAVMTVIAVLGINAFLVGRRRWARRNTPRRPPRGVPPQNAEVVRAALLALTDQEIRVRDGGPEGVDLVAELPALHDDVSTVRIRMSLRPEQHSVHHKTSGHTTLTTPDGWRPPFDPVAAAMKEQLSEAVIAAGWTWHGDN